jgi:hypothetical protein
LHFDVFFQRDTIVFQDSPPGYRTLSVEGKQDTLASADSAGVDTTGRPGRKVQEMIPSMLENHRFQDRKIEPAARAFGSEDWITAHFLVGLIVLAWIRLYYYKRLRQALRGFLSYRYQGMLVREGNILRERISIALIIVYLISTSLLAYLVFTRLLDYKLLQLEGFKLFSFLMLTVILAWVVKNIFNSIIGRVFRNPVVISDYILTNFIFNITLGILLLPILILAVYLPSTNMVYFGAAIWVISFIYRLIRLLFTSLSFTKFSLFNRILYLCTFEIAPVFVLIKLVLSNLG